MAELRPYPFDALIRRCFGELRAHDSVFQLPRAKFFGGSPRHDLSAPFAADRVGAPLGPAAGPHTQMAQNLVLAWLGGSRFFELKTVQVDDELNIPRPCIDMRTVGYNAEWSQELKLEESLEEYVKGAMLVKMLEASGEVEIEPGFSDLVWDLSVGYDLAGIRSPRVEKFLAGMLDCRATVDRLRAQIPAEFSAWRELDYPTRLSNTLTLSTFHGCPPEEIQGIIEHLMRRWGLHCIVKFNPMLLGAETTRGLLHDALGYEEIRVPDSAFTRDTPWDRAVEIMEALDETARELGLSLGAKFSNTLIVENRAGYLPEGVGEVYLSGRPLHVLAMHLVRRFRRHFGDRFGISFSAGIERANFADAVALGIVPVTVCSDLLQPGGYGRQAGYYRELLRRMDAVGARTREEFIRLAYASHSEPGPAGASGEPGKSVEAAADRRALAQLILANTEHYVEGLSSDPRYRAEKNRKSPKKIGSELELFDCISCDKCLPVCPNDANFTLAHLPPRIPRVRLLRDGSAWKLQEEGFVELDQKHQIANFADFCNDCGNCDVFCPEDGGPFVVKPRFFGSAEDWEEFSQLDGFHVHSDAEGAEMLGRIDQKQYRLVWREGDWEFSGDGFVLRWPQGDPASAQGEGPDLIELTPAFLMDWLRHAVLEGERPNYVQSLQGAANA
jgi:putative selenate reductase